MDKHRILVVDDTPANIKVLSELLRDTYHISVATNGMDALELAMSESRPDLILLDIMMPDMDGYEVIERLKSEDYTKHIPVLFVTAKGEAEDETRGLALGAVDYITKPISPPVVQARVKTHLEIKSQRDALQAAYRIIEAQKDRMETELLVGREIQMSMIPQDFPPFPDRNEFNLCAKLCPAKEVGGDFYDYFLIDEDRLCVCIGDVSGKGVPAALFMAVTRTLIKYSATEDGSTARIVSRVNDQLARDNKEFMFVTLFIMILEISSGRMTYTNAGHNPSIILRQDGEITLLDNLHGPAAAAFNQITYHEDTVSLGKGDLLVVYTDGITETHNDNDELFTQARLEALIEEQDVKKPELVVENVFSEVKRFEGEADQFDDITLVVLAYGNDTGV